MADAKKSLMMLGSLGIILLILVIIFAVTFLIGGKFKEKVCTQDGGTYTNGTCSILTDAYNSSVDLLKEVKTAVGFVGLVVLGTIGGILISMAKGFMNDNKSGY